MKKIGLVFIILSLLSFSVVGQVRIKMKKINGVYVTPCKVNGLRLMFVFDTGASNVSLSLSEAVFMLKNGYLEENDLHGSSYSQIANGDIVENTTVNLKELEIGGVKIYNVEAIIIHELSAPLLLGQSAINKLGKVEIDNDILIIKNAISPLSDKAKDKALELVQLAYKYFHDGSYALSTESYQTAYDLYPDVFNGTDYLKFAMCYKNMGNTEKAIYFYNKATEPDYMDDLTELGSYLAHNELAKYYQSIKQYPKALVHAEKALESIRDFPPWERDCYILIVDLYGSLNNYIRVIDYLIKYSKSILKELNQSEDDVNEGKVKSDILGLLYYNISLNHDKLKNREESDEFMVKSALCGYDEAIIFCIKYEIEYKN